MRAADWRHLSGWPLFLAALALFAGGLFNDPPWRGLRDGPQVELIAEPIRAAANLLREGTIANPFGALETGPTAHPPLLWVLAQFVILKLFGFGTAGWFALRCLPAIALSLEYALLPCLARTLGFSAWTGFFAAAFGILTKPGREDRWETHLAGLAILFLTAAASRPRLRPWPIGIGGGCAMLLQPSILPVYFVWVAITARRNVILWIAPLLVCAPWVVRNQVVLGAPLALRDNLGLELYVSFNDCSPYSVRQSFESGCIPSLHPNSSLAEAAAVRELGEYAYNHDRQRRALAWIAAHPARAISLIAQRTWFFWFPSDHGWGDYANQRKRSLPLHVFTVLSFAGLWLALRRRLASARLLALWLVLFPLVYYVVQFEARYRFPILWITWLLAAYALESGWGALREKLKKTDFSPTAVT